jgi:hypothetical protein
MAPTLTVVRCGMLVLRGVAARAHGVARPRAAPPNDSPDCQTLSEDPDARRRELHVVLELCAAQSRGARERAGPTRVLKLISGPNPTVATSDPCG